MQSSNVVMSPLFVFQLPGDIGCAKEGRALIQRLKTHLRKAGAHVYFHEVSNTWENSARRWKLLAFARYGFGKKLLVEIAAQTPSVAWFALALAEAEMVRLRAEHVQGIALLLHSAQARFLHLHSGLQSVALHPLCVSGRSRNALVRYANVWDPTTVRRACAISRVAHEHFSNFSDGPRFLWKFLGARAFGLERVLTEANAALGGTVLHRIYRGPTAGHTLSLYFPFLCELWPHQRQSAIDIIEQSDTVAFARPPMDMEQDCPMDIWIVGGHDAVMAADDKVRALANGGCPELLRIVHAVSGPSAALRPIEHLVFNNLPGCNPINVLRVAFDRSLLLTCDPGNSYDFSRDMLLKLINVHGFAVCVFGTRRRRDAGTLLTSTYRALLTSTGYPLQKRIAVFGESTLVRNFLLDASRWAGAI